jgi:hypothetical protein
MELLKELSEPTNFSHGAILSLSAQSKNDVLTLGGLREEVFVKEHSIARGGLTCIRATCPVYIV